MAADPALSLFRNFKFDEYVTKKKGFPWNEICSMMRVDHTDEECIALATSAMGSTTRGILKVDGSKKWVLLSEHPTAKKINFFQKQLGAYQITLPMALAAKGHLAALELIKDECDFNQQDALGWSAAHYAAAVDRLDIVDQLESWGADLSLRNKRDGTARQIYEIAFPTYTRTLLNGSHFCPFIEVPAELLIADRYTPLVPYRLSEGEIATRETARALLARDPIFAEATVEENDAGEKMPAELGYVAAVTREVKPLDPLWFYGGRVSLLKKGEDSHFFQVDEASYEGKQLGLDAQEVCGPGGLTPDGLPSATAVMVKALNGAPFAIFYVAIIPHDAGIVPTINYGLSHSSKNDHVEIYPSRLALSIDVICEKTSVSSHSRIVANYFFSTPSILLELIANGTINYESIILLTFHAHEAFDEEEKWFAVTVGKLFKLLKPNYSNDELAAIFTCAYTSNPKPHSAAFCQALLLHLTRVTEANEAKKLTPEEFLKDFTPEGGK